MTGSYLRSFHGKKVLVTGGFGFIGSNLCVRLLDLGADLTVMDRVAPAGQFHQIPASRSAMRILVADIRNLDAVQKAVAGQDVIFNLAGASGAAHSNKTPLKDIDVNCRGHLTLLEACRAVNSRVSMVFPSSRLVYGRPQQLPVNEEHPVAPESIYAVHKLAVENYLFLYARSFGLKATVLRISNPYGPFQSREFRSYGIANRFIQAAVAGEAITLFGNGKQQRDYLYIDDLVDVLLRCAWSNNSNCKIYNIGSGEGTRLSEMAKMAVAAVGKGKIERVPWPPDDQAIETGDYVSDIRRATTELGWRPAIGIREGIERTVAYYQRPSRRFFSMTVSTKGNVTQIDHRRRNESALAPFDSGPRAARIKNTFTAE
jgi:nucleoside-diphosphate-sugar epimerase